MEISSGGHISTKFLKILNCITKHLLVYVDCKIGEFGFDYMGVRNYTQSGRVCQRWDKQFPHKHNYNEASMYPDATVRSAKNYCRNPDSEEPKPWCYTTDPDVRWEYCAIPLCGNIFISYKPNELRIVLKVKPFV